MQLPAALRNTCTVYGRLLALSMHKVHVLACIVILQTTRDLGCSEETQEARDEAREAQVPPPPPTPGAPQVEVPVEAPAPNADDHVGAAAIPSMLKPALLPPRPARGSSAPWVSQRLN